MDGLQRLARYAWAAPASALGLVLALAALPFGARWRNADGVLEVAVSGADEPTRLARALLRLPYRAITLGHVVVGVTVSDLERLRTHEHAHVAQYERWGPIFLLAYPFASLVGWGRGGHAYRDNRFEVEARSVAQRAQTEGRDARVGTGETARRG